MTAREHPKDRLIDRAEPTARALIACIGRRDHHGARRILARPRSHAEQHALVIALAAIAAQHHQGDT